MSASLVSYYRAMARNNAWSNHRLVSACGTLTAAEYAAARTSFFPSLALTLSHIVAVDGYYLDALEGCPRPWRDEAPYTTVAALQRVQSVMDRRLIAFCDALHGPQLDRVITLMREGSRVVAERTDRVLAHLFLHQIHHRGQAHAMLAGTTTVPPQLDEFLLTEDAPLRADALATLGFTEAETWPLDPDRD